MAKTAYTDVTTGLAIKVNGAIAASANCCCGVTTPPPTTAPPTTAPPTTAPPTTEAPVDCTTCEETHLLVTFQITDLTQTPPDYYETTYPFVGVAGECLYYLKDPDNSCRPGTWYIAYDEVTHHWGLCSGSVVYADKSGGCAPGTYSDTGQYEYTITNAVVVEDSSPECP